VPFFIGEGRDPATHEKKKRRKKKGDTSHETVYSVSRKKKSLARFSGRESMALKKGGGWVAL